eukprot:7997542-Alexandrium_andersonii.AAC.1
MGDQVTRGESGAVLDFWGFRVLRTANSPEVPLAAEWVPPFEPGINELQFTSYPTEVIEDSVPLAGFGSGAFGPGSLSA